MSLGYTVEYAKSGRSSCKKSKAKIDKDAMRIGKIVPSMHGEEGDTMLQWFLPGPFFEMMRNMRKDSKKVESLDDLAGCDELRDEDKAALQQMITDFWNASVTVTKAPAKKRPKKEADEEEDDAEEKPKPAKKPKAAAAKKPKHEPHASEVVPFSMATAKALALDLVARAKADGIKMPTDDAEATRSAGGFLISLKAAGGDAGGEVVDLGGCLDALADQFGTSKGAKLMEVANEANRALAELFKELSAYDFKAQNKQGGLTYIKVAKAFAACPDAIADGKQATKLGGVGKGTAAKVDEFFETGKIQKLEDYRASGGV